MKKIENKNEKGVVYVITNKINEYFKQYKIGKTEDLETRLKKFNTDPITSHKFYLKFKIEMPAERAFDFETRIHHVLVDFQVKGGAGKEFFKADLDIIRDAVNFTVKTFRDDFSCKVTEYPDIEPIEKLEEPKQESDTTTENKKRNTYSFASCGYKDGDTLYSRDDDSITCTIVHPDSGLNYVVYNGSEISLTKATCLVLGKNIYHSARYWKDANGTLLESYRKS